MNTNSNDIIQDLLYFIIIVVVYNGRLTLTFVRKAHTLR